MSREWRWTELTNYRRKCNSRFPGFFRDEAEATRCRGRREDRWAPGARVRRTCQHTRATSGSIVRAMSHDAGVATDSASRYPMTRHGRAGPRIRFSASRAVTEASFPTAMINNAMVRLPESRRDARIGSRSYHYYHHLPPVCTKLPESRRERHEATRRKRGDWTWTRDTDPRPIERAAPIGVTSFLRIFLFCIFV